MRIKYLCAQLCALLAGCSTPGHIRVTREGPDGVLLTADVSTPSGAVEPATVITDDWSVSTGSGQGIDQALASLSSTTSWLAIGLILAGIASLCLSMKIPMIPRATSIVLIASGAGLFAFPLLLDRYAWVVLLALVGLGGLWVWGLFDNRKKIKTPVE